MEGKWAESPALKSPAAQLKALGSATKRVWRFNMRIAVLGSGNGGCAVAFDCAVHKHSVRLFDFDTFPDNIKRIQQQGGIFAEGVLEGFASIEYAGHNIKEALSDVDVIYAVGPAYSTRPFAEVCRPFLRKGQFVIVCPGSGMGSIEFKNEAQLSLRNEDIIIAETSTLPYAVRVVEPGRIQVFLKVKGGLFVTAVPSRNTSQVTKRILDVYPAMAPAKNVIQTSLQNGNPVIHPAITLLNTALIERTKGNFLFYEEGVTPAVGRLIKAIDQERIAIGRAFNVEIIPEPELGYMQGYMAEATYDRGYSKAPGFRGIKAQSSLDYRYFHEDVGYGLVFWQSLAEQVGVETPHISAVIRLASVLMGQDYLARGKRTLKSLGLSGYTARELEQLLS
jgi:opine dehydrogenase